VPFTTNTDLTKSLKHYKREFCNRHEDLGVPDDGHNLLAYKVSDHKNGSISIPYTSVFLRRNLGRVIDHRARRKREEKQLGKVIVMRNF
jgi:hypothetical protein